MNLSAIWEVIGVLIALATLPGTLELFALTTASLFWKSPQTPEEPPVLKIAILIPAHNEESNIQECLRSLLTSETGLNQVQIVVIADNCTDQTSRKATELGARVLNRTDPENRGKGHALSYAFQKLLTEQFNAFIVIDADTTVENNFIQSFSSLFSKGADAIQCRNLPVAPEESPRNRLMNLALLAFNVTRPRGRNKLGFSSGIFGNGFGLSRRTLESVPYHPGSIAEDLEYHISLVRNGIMVMFADDTTVRSLFPHDEKTASVQRSRWEGGRFRVMINCVPTLIKDFLKGKVFCLESLFDLLTLPLVFHVALIVLAALTSKWGRLYSYCALCVVVFHVFSTIITSGSRQDFKAMMVAPIYIIWKIAKLPLILKTTGKNATWVRTPRQEKRKEKKP